MNRDVGDGTEESLSRRGMLIGLSGAVAGSAAYGYGSEWAGSRSAPGDADSDERDISSTRIATLQSVASAVYPSAIDVDSDFIERQVLDRTEPRPDHFDEMESAIETVDTYAKARFGDRMKELSEDDRRRVLHSVGATRVRPTADGTTAERVRYYLINDLLYALFTSALSSELTGIENPPGHPGGREAYQRGPDR